MIGGNQVIIYGLGDSNHPQCITFALSKFGNFISSVLGVITTAVKEIANVVCLKNFEDTLILLIGFKFKATSSKCRSRSVAEATDILL